MGLETQYVLLDDVLLVRLQGELDHHEAKKLRADWQFMLQDSKCLHVVLNMGAVSFMDSSGIGVILGRYKEIVARGGSLVVASLHEHVEQIFNMAGLRQIIHTEETEIQACHYLGVDPSCKTR